MTDLSDTQSVFAGEGPWTWYLAEAWQQAAAPDLFAGSSPRPDTYEPPKRATDQLDLRVAYWAPLLHLTSFGLGWKFPELGLWRWVHEGRPTDDPILGTIEARYGEHVELMMTWLVEGAGPPLRKHGFRSSWGAERTEREVALRKRAAVIRTTPQYRASFSGGSDPLHLLPHLCATWHAHPMEVDEFVAVPSSHADRVLVSSSYGSLFAALRSSTVPAVTDGRATRVALVCPPVGWLGTYRSSRDTGLWFRGQHRWHQLGN